jgi:hypothetical protein
VELKTVTLVNEVFQSLSPGTCFSIELGNETLLPDICVAASRDGWHKVFNTKVSLDLGFGRNNERRLARSDSSIVEVVSELCRRFFLSGAIISFQGVNIEFGLAGRWCPLSSWNGRR